MTPAVDLESRVRTHRHASSLGEWVEVRAVPHPALAPFITTLWYGEGRTFYDEDRILPQGAAHLLINIGSPQFLTRHPDGRRLRTPFRDIWLSGAQKSYLDTQAPDGTALVGVAFQPHGAFRLLGIDQGEISGEVADLSELLGDKVLRLKDRVQSAATPEARIELVESWLLERARVFRPVHPVVPHVVTRIAASDGRVRILEMAASTGFSRMHLRRLFLREVGLTPKWLARLYRFHAALRRLESGHRVDWSSLALDLGYYDQSHLSRDFREFAGRSPSAVLKANRPDDVTLVVE